jgi:hypothetical protein
LRLRLRLVENLAAQVYLVRMKSPREAAAAARNIAARFLSELLKSRYLNLDSVYLKAMISHR